MQKKATVSTSPRNHLPGDLTCYNEVKRLTLNSYTLLLYKDNAFSVTRFYPTKEPDLCRTEEEYRAVIEKAARLSQNTTHLIPMKQHQPLTQAKAFISESPA